MNLGNIKDIINLAITNNIASAISLGAGYGFNEVADLIVYGGKAQEGSIYDLASLTKIISTTPLVVKAISDNKMSLEEEPFTFWPKVSIAHLLAHTSGLPAHVHFYKKPEVFDRSAFFNELFKERLINPPGKERTYSDLGFLALGYLLEERYKKSLKDLFKESSENFFISPLALNDDIVPTTRLGEVHDNNAHFLGGFAGHAGLFGRLRNVMFMGRYFLRCYKNPQNYQEEILRYFMKNHLGFDKPRKGGSTISLSPFSFGHFGYTGVSLWIDPKAFNNEGIIIALLTNRVKNSEDSKGIFWLRKKVHDVIAKSSGDL